MLKDDIGAKLRSKRIVRSDSDSITFQYKTIPVTLIWGPLERKPYQTARQRYEREKRLSLELHQQDLRVPEILESHDDALELRVRRLRDSHDFLNWVLHSLLPSDVQEQCLYEAILLLKDIHKIGPRYYHGDSYLKNFLLRRVGDSRFTVHTTGMQYERNSKNPQMTDLQILLASSISALRYRSRLTQEDIFRLTRSTYGMLGGADFTLRDRIFYRMRFEVGSRFFQFFERGY